MNKNVMDKDTNRSKYAKSPTKTKIPVSRKSDLLQEKKQFNSDEIKSFIINDTEWKCTIVMVAVVNERLSNSLLRQLANTPEHLTIITRSMLNDISKDPRPEKISSMSPDTDKVSKRSISRKSNKSKTNKFNKKSRNRNSLLDTTSGILDISQTSQFSPVSCLSLKKMIINLRNSDLSGKSRDVHFNTLSNKIKKDALNDNEVIKHRYILLWGFYDPGMPHQLSSFFIPVRAIIQISLEVDGQFDNLDLHTESKKVVRSKNNNTLGEISKEEFNNLFHEMIIGTGETEYLKLNKDLLMLSYQINESNTKGIDSIKFDQHMLEILCEIKEAWEQFEIYKATVYIQEVPNNKQYELKNAELYNTMIAMVPLECVNIAIVLECILEEIVWQEKNSVDEVTITGTSLTKQLSHLKKSNENVVTLSTINGRNKVKYNTMHLMVPELDFEKIVQSLFVTSPVYRIWDNFPPLQGSQSRWYKFQLQMLENCAGDIFVNKSKLFNAYLQLSLMNIFICKYKQLSINQIKSHIIQEPPKLVLKETSNEDINLRWYSEEGLKCFSNCEIITKISRQEKFKYLKSFLLCQHFVNLLDEVNMLGNELVNYLDNYKFIEELNSVDICQSLQEAYETFLNVNYEYFTPTDSILLWFHNCHIPIKNEKYILKTFLGFRDFYKYHLQAKTEFSNDTKLENNQKLSETFTGCSTPNIKQNQVSNKYSIKANDCHPFTVYNLGPFWMEATEFTQNFFSPDSSSVSVKTAHYFNNKATVSVRVKKNNTSLKYEICSDRNGKPLQIQIQLYDGILINCYLESVCNETSYSNCVEPSRNSSLDDMGTTLLKLDCTMNITIPSGLLIDVVPTKDVNAPFYIRQRYLDKGPSCSKIWEENYRCYLNNGTILIFCMDGTVKVLYSNGTIINCTKFELFNIELTKLQLKNDRDTKIEYNNTESKSMKTKRPVKGKNIKSIKLSKDNDNVVVKLNSIGDFLSESKCNKATLLPVSKLTNHSVLSWDGVVTEFLNGENKTQDNNLKNVGLKYAVDTANEELYLCREDGMECLLSPTSHVIIFPNGTKVTSYAHDDKELITPDFTLVNVDTCSTYTTQSESSDISNKSPNYNENVQERNITEGSFVYIENEYVIQHNNYATVEFLNQNYSANIIFNDVTINITKDGLFSININEYENIRFLGSSLVFEANVLQNCAQKSCTTLHFNNVEGQRMPSTICKTVDSFANSFSVDEHGNASHFSNNESEVRYSGPPYAKFPQNKERFFVFKRDLSGYEIIHKSQEQNCSFLSSKCIKDTTKDPLLERNNLFCLRSNIYVTKNKSEEYTMTSTDEHLILPTFIKHKDLIKIQSNQNREGVIWFRPELTTATEDPWQRKNKEKKPVHKAILSLKWFNIKMNHVKLMTWLTDTMEKYVSINENIYKSYLQSYQEDNTTKEDNDRKEKTMSSDDWF